MPLQTWDVVVHGRSHRVELDRNPESGKHVVRVDGRMAFRPFSEDRGEFPLEIGGRPYLLRLSPGACELEDKGSRYVDPSQPRAASLGRLTVCRGLEQITVIADSALVRIESIAEGYARALVLSAGGGLAGALAAGVGIAAAEKLSNRFGPTTRNQPIRSFDDLPGEVVCRVEHLPLDLVALFSDRVDLEARVLVVPRRAVAAIEAGRTKLTVRTTGGGKPHAFEVGGQLQDAIDHLHAARYPLHPEAAARASASAVEQRERGAAEVRNEPRPAAPLPSAPPPSADVVRAGGLPEVRWTTPLVTAIGRDPALLQAMESDARAYRPAYPKTLTRKAPMDEPLRRLGKERYDLVHLHGVYDDKTRFREQGGWAISLKDLVERVGGAGTRLLWLASPNDPRPAAETLRWAGGINIRIVLTIARGDDFGTVLEEAVRRMAGGEGVTAILADLEPRSSCCFQVYGRGEAVFLAR